MGKSILIGVTFRNGERDVTSKEYTFKSYITDLTVGDAVVVDTVNGMCVAYVTNLKAKAPGKGDVVKEVVDLIDMLPFIARRNRVEKMKELKSKMDERIKELQDVAIYEMLAEKDPSLRSMLSDFNTLKEFEV